MEVSSHLSNLCDQNAGIHFKLPRFTLIRDDRNQNIRRFQDFRRQYQSLK